MKKIYLLTTGGTIASVENEEGRFASGQLTGEQLIKKLQIPANIRLHVESILQKPSFHITIADLVKIKNRIHELMNDETVDGIVVTHGTDTLEESAYFLDLTVPTKKPVVITGSQRAPEEEGSDAYINLKHAIITASTKNISGAGVVVVFNERIYTAKHVTKEHASNLQGFTSFGYGYLGIIDNDEVFLYQKPVEHESYVFNDRFIPKVDIIKGFLDGDDKYIRCAIEHKVDGLIIEGAGRGQVPPTFMESIELAIISGIEVIITTSSEEGRTFPTYEYIGSAYDLLAKGAILAGELDSKKARMKLLVLLSSGVNVKENFAKGR